MTELSDLLAACNTVQADKYAAASTKVMAGKLKAWAATVPTPVPPTDPTVLFFDDFTGPAGLPPNPAAWVNRDGIVALDGSAAKAANAFLDGSSHLVLQVTPESWKGSDGVQRSTAGAIVGTYQYQTGWPPKPVLRSFPTPFRYEVRFLLPSYPGMWVNVGWLQNIDRTGLEGYHELDCGECRTVTSYGTSQHLWKGSPVTDVLNEGSHVTGPDGSAGYQVLAVEVTGNGNSYYLNGAKVTSHSGATGSFGVILHNVLGDGGPAPATPQRLLVDYVKVTALA